MPIPNPVYGLMVPFLCVVTLPLAIFAGITTTLAFSVLMFRVMLGYLDIVVSLVPQYLMGRSGSSQAQSYAVTSSTLPHSRGRRLEGSYSPKSPGPGSGHSTPPLLLPAGYLACGPHSPTRTSAAAPQAHAHFASAPSSVISPSAGRSRSRRGSVGGNSVATSVGTITPVQEESPAPPDEDGRAAWLAASGVGPRSSSSAVLLHHHRQQGMVRDFEGVGGWRLASEGRAEDDDDDDSDWANINSRLELPLERMRQQQQQHPHQGPHHYRTSSAHSGSVTPGEGSWLMMKGVKSRRGEGPVVAAADGADWERDASRVPTGGAASSGRASVSPNSSRVRMGQAMVTFAGGERNEGYFPSVRKGTTL